MCANSRCEGTQHEPVMRTLRQRAHIMAIVGPPTYPAPTHVINIGSSAAIFEIVKERLEENRV